MLLEELFEQEGGEKKLVVVYGGRFQPFHRGHYHVYLWLCKKFGKENVWIATSDKTNFNEKDGDVSPFTYKEKLEIITGLYGIEPRRVVKCKNPTFSPKEVFSMYRGFDIVYVSAVGKKDKQRYADSDFFIPLPSEYNLPEDVDKLVPLDEKKGYYVSVPMKRDGMSGTEVRASLNAADEGEVKKMFKEYFGKYDDVIADMILAKIKDVK